MNLAELASEQMAFLLSRTAKDGKTLWDIDTKDHLCHRLREEIDEFEEEIQDNDPEKQLSEVADLYIFVTSIAAKLALEHGMPLEAITEAVKAKLRRNEEKYSVENFARADSVMSGVIYSKDHWSPSS